MTKPDPNCPTPEELQRIFTANRKAMIAGEMLCYGWDGGYGPDNVVTLSELEGGAPEPSERQKCWDEHTRYWIPPDVLTL